MTEKELPPLEEQLDKRTMKHFADIYFQKQKSDKNLHAHNARERMFEVGCFHKSFACGDLVMVFLTLFYCDTCIMMLVLGPERSCYIPCSTVA